MGRNTRPGVPRKKTPMYPAHKKAIPARPIDAEHIKPRTYDDVGSLDTNEHFQLDRNES